MVHLLVNGCGRDGYEVVSTDDVGIAERLYLVDIHVARIENGYRHALSAESGVVKRYAVDGLYLFLTFAVGHIAHSAPAPEF